MQAWRDADGDAAQAWPDGRDAAAESTVMMAIDARTPVLVGAGVAHQRSDDPAEAAEAVELMTTAVERAGDDAHAPALLGPDESRDLG